MSVFDFDRPIDRINTDSVKWRRFGADVIPLWVADMDFVSPPGVGRAVEARLAHGIYGYVDGCAELEQILAQRMQTRYGWEVKPAEVKGIPGVLSALHIAITTFSDTGEEVLLFTPAYPPFLSLVPHTGRVLKEIPLREIREQHLRYEIDFEALTAALTKKSRILLLCSPHNPTGTLLGKDVLTRLCAFAEENNLLLISDEIHSELLLEGTHLPAGLLSPHNTITFGGPSKTFNLPGLKVGTMIVQDKEKRDKLYAGMKEVLPEVSSLSYCAAIGAYQTGDEWLKELLEYIRGNRRYSLEFLSQTLPDAKLTCPSGTYMLWGDFSAYAKGDTPFDIALKKGKVACGRGIDFGTSYLNYLRITLASPRDLLAEGLDRLAQALRI